MEDNLRSIYDKLVSSGSTGTYDEFVSFFNENDQNKKSVYDKLMTLGSKGTYDEFLAYAGAGQQPAPGRVDVSDVQQAEQGNTTVTEATEIPTVTMDQVEQQPTSTPAPGSDGHFLGNISVGADGQPKPMEENPLRNPDNQPAEERTIPEIEVQKQKVDEVSQALSEATRQRNEQRAQQQRERDEEIGFWGRLAKGLQAAENPITPEVVEVITNPTDNDLRAAQNEVRNAKKQLQLEEMRQNGEMKGLAFIRGIETANYYDLIPVLGTADAMSILSLSQALKEGKELTESQQLLLQAMEARAGVDFNYKDNNTIWERVGQSTPEQLMFTLQFVFGAGLTGATEAGERIAAKEAQKAAIRYAKKGVNSGARRFIGGTVIPKLEGMAVSSTIQTFANPLSLANMAEDFERRYAGDIYYDNDGNLHVFDNDRSAGQAAYQAIASAWIENFTEYSGQNITKSIRLADGKMFDLAGKFDNVMKNVGGGRIKDVFTVPQKLSHLTQIGSAPEEFLEEELGSVMNALMATDANRGESYGDAFKRSVGQSFSGEQQLETFLSCAITSMLLGGGGNAVNAVGNAGYRRQINQEVEKSKALLGKVRGIDMRQLDNAIDNGSIGDISAYLKEQSDANGWSQDEQGAAVSYVMNRARQIGMKHHDDTAIEEAQAEMRKQAEDMANRWDGNIYNATWKDNEGNEQPVTIINGRIHYTTRENGTIHFNPYTSSGMIAIRLADGTKKQVPSRTITGIQSVMSVDEQLEAQGQTIPQMMQAQFEQEGMAIPTVESVWGGNLVANETQFENGKYTYLGQDQNGLYAFANNDKKTQKDNPIIYMTERQLVEYGLSLNIQAANTTGDTETAQQAQDDLDFMQHLDELTAEATEKDQWDVVKAYASRGFTYEENGMVSVDTDPRIYAAYLLACAEGSFENAMAGIDESVAALVGQQSQQEQAADISTEAGFNAENMANAEQQDGTAAKAIDFYNSVYSVLFQMQAGQQDAVEESVNEMPVSQMEVGQEFPVTYDGQQAVAVVVGKDADGRSVVTIRDQEGNDLESGIDDWTDEQWERFKLRPEEVAMPSQQTEQQESAEIEQKPTEIEQNAPEIEQKEPENEHQEEVAVSPAQQTFDGLVQKYGDKAGHKIDVTAEDKSKTLDKAKKALEKAQTDYDDAPIGKEEKAEAALQKAQEEYNTALAEKQEWDEVKAVKDRFVAERLAAQQAADEERHAQAVAEEEARRAEEERKAREREATGANNVAPNIREKWEGAPRVEGNADEITLANGERIAGHYVLVESGAASASHDALNGFAKTEGFPLDENEQSVNDRDYERDKNAQQITRQIANEYDSRALQDPVVVSQDGVVLSGNGRTMAGEIAAAQDTDGAYIDYLKKYAPKYGFTTEQVEGMAHPRVVFVPDASMPYTAETFAKFNQQEMKGQSKTEQAVKLGKLVDDATFGRIIRSINRFDTLGDFYADTKATAEAIGELLKAGAINQMQHTEMFDGDAISAQGREILENMLIGKAFESNPDAVRQLTAFKSLRQSVITALAEISNNIALGEYSLESELSEAIALAYNARKNGYKAGDAVSEFARQGKLFETEEDATAADYTNATVLMLADVMNDNRVTRLKKVLSIYNQQAEQSAAGQTDLFAEGVKTKQEILDEVLVLLQHGTESEQQQALDAAREQRKAAAEQGTGVQENGDTGEGDAGERGNEQSAGADVGGRQTDLGGSQPRQSGGENTEEVDENGRPFVKAADGSTVFGEIRESSGLQPAPIKLSEGYQDQDGKGYGLVHIEANHGEQIRNEGFETVEDFVSYVAQNYDEDNIRVGKRRENGNTTFLIQVTDEHDNTLFIELSQDGSYWNVNSAGVFRKGYSNKKETVAKTEPQQPNNTVSTDSSLSESEESGIAPSEPNGESTVSDGKNTENSETESEKQENISETAETPMESAGEGTGQTPPGPLSEGELGPTDEAVAAANEEVDTNPTEAQKEAGNYKKGHVTIDGFDISIENPAGSTRSGTDAQGNPWSVTMHNSYGYIRMTEGVDGDHIDIFLSDHIDDWNGTVYVVDQVNADGSFDEHKVMYGFNSAEEAREAYLSNYSEGWQGLGTITGVSREEFKKWVDSSHRKTKAFADYKSVQPTGGKTNDGTNGTDNQPEEIPQPHYPSVKKVAEMRKKYPDALFLIHVDDYYQAYGEDAQKLSQILGVKLTEVNGVQMALIHYKDFDTSLRKLVDAKQKVALAEEIVKNKKTKKEEPKKETREELDRRLMEERKQRILAEGTSFDKPFGLVPVSETMTVEDIDTNMQRIAEGLKANEGNKDFGNFYGFAYQGNFKENLGQQLKNYYQSLTGAVDPKTLMAWAGSHGFKTYDDVVEYGKGLYDETNKTDTTDRTKGTEKTDKTETEPKKQPKAPSKAGSLKIDDVGEKIAGARKDMRREIAKGIGEATVQSLIELPFSKAFKKPNLKKAVESGALREEDAFFFDAWLASTVNQTKPKVTQQEVRRKRYNPNAETNLERWAKQTFEALDFLKTFVEADETERDRIIGNLTAEVFPKREAQLAEFERIRELNKGRNDNITFGDCLTPNPVWVTYQVMQRLGYAVGDKLDIPFGILRGNTTGTSYYLYNTKDEHSTYIYPNSLEEGIDAIVWLARIKRGDTDIQHPVSAFYTTPTKSEMGDSGRFRVVWGAWSSMKNQEFDSKEAAEAFAAKKKDAYVNPIQEVKRRFGYKIMFRNPLTGERTAVSDMEFDTKAEAEAYMDGNYETMNDGANEMLAKESGTKKEVTADDVVGVTVTYGKDGWQYAAVITAAYANNMGMPLVLQEFKTRGEAKACADSVKDKVFETYRQYKAKQKEFVYFGEGEDTRIGEDYRGGKDVSAEDFMNTFGFRGVQFGNWTNQADRQMAVNQAYDAFMDLAKLIGMSPRAMSLNGELGIAFGARGSGNANAHYEYDEVVINLTKTRGAGSLAHEWWHALDNYFARRGGMGRGMVTDVKSIAMRDELRKAYDRLIDEVQDSNYYKRSVSKGDYWGRMHEVTARLLAEWVNRELKQKGELNTFLARGVDTEKFVKMNYELYKMLMDNAGREAMPFDEYKELDEALSGMPYPSDKEIDAFSDALRNIFETIEEREGENGAVELFSIDDGTDVAYGTDAQQVAYNAVREALANAGIEVVEATEEDVKRLKDSRKQLKDSKGTIRGWVGNDGKIHLTKDGLNAETPIHEYTHLWAEALQMNNPELWEQIKGLLKDTPEWKRITSMKEYSNLKDDDRIAGEVLAHISGKRNAERMEAEAKRMIDEAPTLEEAAKAANLLGRMRNALKKFWTWVGKTLLGRKGNINIDQVSNMVLADLTNGIDPFHPRGGKRTNRTNRTDASVEGEMERIKREAQANGTFMKAPNGKPTKLTERQWLQVRTEAFKKWFGDWEKHFHIEKLRKSAPVSIEKKDYDGKFSDRASAKEWMRENIKGEYTNADTNEVISITNVGINEVTSHGTTDDAHMKSLVAIPKMLENSIFITELPNTKGNDKYDSYRYYVVGLKIDGEDYTAKIVVGVKGDSKYYDHRLTEIEKGSLIDDLNRLSNSVAENQTSDFVGKDTKLSEILRDDSSKILDEDGEPMVVYHGGKGEITVFDKNRIGENLDYGTMGSGFYFTSDRENAENYARNAQGEEEPTVVEAFLNIRNAKDVNWNELDGESQKKSVAFTDKAIAKGHDGFTAIAPNKAQWIVAFNPNQIKSATENNGDFDPDNDDIRFSITGPDNAIDNIGDETDETDRTDEAEMSDEEAEKYDAGRMTFTELATEAVLKAAEKNKEDLRMRNEAVKAIGVTINRVRKAMAKQKEYDKATVDSIVRLARMMIENGYMDNMSRSEVKRLMTLAKNATGKTDITKQANAVVDLMLKHQLKAAEAVQQKLLSTKGSKVNASGVEVQAGLDITGQRVIKAMREGIALDEKALADRIADTEDRMGGTDKTLAANAAEEYEGLMMAKDYHDMVRQSEQDEAKLRHELDQAKEDVKNGTLDRKAYKELAARVDSALRKNMAERVTAFTRLNQQLTEMLAGSKGRAKEFREKQMERVREIHHNANSDMKGTSASEHKKAARINKVVNSGIVRFLFKPVATFDEMLRFFGRKSVDGQGYLWQRFMGGYIDAADTEWRSLKKDHDALDEKVSEVMGGKMRWSDLFSMERKMDPIEVEFYDLTTDKEGNSVRVKEKHTLTQGNALYIYMVNKMDDGAMKLRRMGITDEDVDRIAGQLDPRFLQLADWIQDEFLPKKRDAFTAVHMRMFGAPMAAIEEYFPLVINSRSRGQEEDINDTGEGDLKISTITGSIIKRTVNTTALDLTNADAFDVLLGHLRDMEHWAAFAEFIRDANTLISYKHFRNQVLNMSSVRFGAGEVLWKNFKKTCSIAAGVYRPKADEDSIDNAIVNISKGVTSSKISFRLYTALKQLLSYPAYFSEANPIELAKSTGRPAKAFNWALDNLPGFAERWQSRQAGDSRLKDTDADWDFWKNKFVETAARWGMTPNAFVDGITVAMGAKAIYESKMKGYLKAGYSDAEAKEKALKEASAAVNETQQSSQNAYLSAMQLDRTVASVALTVFRNASMGYERRMLRAVDNIKRKFTMGYKEESIEFMRKKMVRDGLTEEQAKAASERAWNISIAKDVANVVIFGFVMQLAWNLGSSLMYLVFGDDDDEKEKMWEDAAMHALAGPVEGLSGGSVISEVYNMARSGKNISNYNFQLLPIMSDLQTTMRHMEQDKVRGIQDIVNLLISMGIGVNPQTITDGVVSIVDAADGDLGVGKEIGMLMLRIAQVPQSQLDQLYIDELGMSAKDAKGLPMEELAQRYAAYKRMKDAPLTGWAYSDEAKEKVDKRYVNKFVKLIQERVANMDDEALERNMDDNDDLMLKKQVGKEVASRLEGKDTYGNQPQSNWKEETKKAHLAYQQLRGYVDLCEDVVLQKAQADADKAYEAALEEGKWTEAQTQQMRAKGIEQAREQLNKMRRQLGQGNGQYDQRIMEGIRQARHLYMEYYGLVGKKE